MDRQRWQQIERLYHAAWAQPADARAGFLAGACPDARVRREVESLIAQATGGHLATGAGFAAESTSDEQAPGVEVRRLGVNSPPPSLRIARVGSPTGHLPSDLAADQLDRLVLFSLVSGGLWSIALGCVAYFILTGQEVFQSGTRNRMETLIDHVHASPVRPSERSALPIPPSVDALVLSCLQKDPNDRPQDATEVLKRIDDCHVTGTWSSERAHAWWLKHLPNPAGTLTVAAAAVVATAS